MAAVSSEGAAVRAAAARAVAEVGAGRSLDSGLPSVLRGIEKPADRALTQALVYGVIRDYRLLAALRDRLLRDPQKTPAPLLALLLVGLHQLRSTRIPAHAAVAASVAACPLLGHDAARGLVNAILRRYQREARTLEAALPGTPALRHSYPDWLVTALRRDWPQQWRAILAAGNQPGPMTLRVNPRRGALEAQLAQLQGTGIEAHRVPGAPAALRLLQPRDVRDIPGFVEGRISVQDAAAQLAAPLLDARPGMRVLDACAAPGGKTAHLLETVDDLDLLALDVDDQRLDRVRDNLRRLDLHATLHCADAATPDSWWDGRPFDRILLDAPCSGTGVIRRHPDIKRLRRATDIKRLAGQQRQLLDALWPLLAPGGVLLYATCSILNDEGAAVTANFLHRHADAHELPILADWGEAVSVGRRIPPGADYDGFYYARLSKRQVSSRANYGTSTTLPILRRASI